jgi:putative transposase
MPNYVRPRVTGARIFFTVALAERGSDLLVRVSADVELTRVAG